MNNLNYKNVVIKEIVKVKGLEKVKHVFEYECSHVIFSLKKIAYKDCSIELKLSITFIDKDEFNSEKEYINALNGNYECSYLLMVDVYDLIIDKQESANYTILDKKCDETIIMLEMINSLKEMSKNYNDSKEFIQAITNLRFQ